MNIKRSILFILMITLLTFGCQEEFLLVTKDHNSILVVDGIITNEPGPYTVKLSLSSQVNDPKMIPYSSCILTIFENTGLSEVLTELEPGVYKTSESGIQGKTGNQYRIKIVTPDNKEYETAFQEIKEPVEIDTIYAELIIKEIIGFPYGLPGYQFYVDTKLAFNHESYFLWSMSETFQYTADYKVFQVYNVEGSYIDYYNLYRCWDTQKVKTIFTGKTSNLSTPKLVHIPLHFVSTETRRLQERYSLLLNQYSIGKDDYYYWKSIESQITQENFLVANQPYNITGNIKNINNPDETIFGNFTVASVTQKRIFVDRPRVAFYYEEGCGINFSYFILIEKGYPVYLIETKDARLGAVNESCIDCTSKGGVLVKPEFWIDK